LSIERFAHKAAEDYCNIQDFDMEKAHAEVEARVKRAFGRYDSQVPEGFFFNQDPRGYALKIDNEVNKNMPEGFYTDWGGYFILAPEFD
jgi:hypothetical protein